MLCLTVRYGEQVLRFPLPKSDASVGSSAENDIVLPFPGVSRRHARVVVDGSTLRLCDTGSKNRLILNGERRDEVRLVPGERVQIGRAVLSIDDGSTSDILLGLRIANDEKTRRRRPTERETGEIYPSGESQGRALAVIRDLAFATDHALTRNLATFLRQVREVVMADGMFVLNDARSAHPGLTATSGQLPDEEVIAVTAIAIARSRGRREPVVAEHATSVIVAVPGGSARRHEALVAVFPIGFRTPPWIHDFLEFAAHRLLRDTATPASDAPAPTDGDLVLPDGMIIGDSPAIGKLMANMRATVRSRLDVLLLGETGTGKELFARLIHASGPSATGPFVAINCAAIPSELLEAELFGVVGRVATGVDPKPGHFLQADGGSIFLDEIGELTDPLQAKLLRVLQEREILSLGALAPRRISVRVIAASNSDLYGRTRSGRFRADLYYRLRGLQFHIPPLRERPEDIPALVLAFVSRACTTYGKNIAGVSRRALSLLMTHSWPGNVRELQNEVERAVLLCHNGGVLQGEHFAPVKWIVETAPPPATEDLVPASDSPPAAAGSSLDLQARVDAVEKQTILDALQRTGGNRSKAAQLLGITRNGLSMKMARLGLNGR